MHCHICLQTHVCTGMTTTLYNLCSGIEALAFSGYVALLGDPIQILFFRKYVPDIEIPLTSASPLSQLNSNTRDSILSTHMGPYRLKSRSGVRRSYILTVIREDFGPKTNWITLKQKTTKKKRLIHQIQSSLSQVIPSNNWLFRE